MPTVNCSKLFEEHDGEDTHTDRPIYSQSFDDLFTNRPLKNWICPNLTSFEIGEDYGLAVRVVTCKAAKGVDYADHIDCAEDEDNMNLSMLAINVAFTSTHFNPELYFRNQLLQGYI